MIHTTVTPKDQTVSFSIPKEYIGKEIEVIAFAKNEGILEDKFMDKQVSFDAIAIDTRGYKFNRDEANER